MTSTDSFEDRVKIGDNATARLVKRLEQHGLIVTKTGQEYVLKSGVHPIIRFQRNFTAEFARHFPDLLCAAPNLEPFYAEAKATSEKYWEGPNFSVETASLDICQFLDRNGVHIAIFFENRPDEFYADWAKNIKPFRQDGYAMIELKIITARARQ